MVTSGIRETPRRLKGTFGGAETVPLPETQADPPAPSEIRLVNREVEDVCDSAGIVLLLGAEADAQVAPAVEEASRELDDVAGDASVFTLVEMQQMDASFFPGMFGAAQLRRTREAELQGGCTGRPRFYFS